MNVVKYNTRVSKIENLPKYLKEFDCSYSQVSKIENLPEFLDVFNCSLTRVSKIENLPESLKVFHFCSAKLTKIENLPIGLQQIDYSFNIIKFIDNVENERISFTLKGYQSIRRIQKRIKRRYKTKIKAMIVIQRGCHNWIWKPLCNDGTIGIRPRLDMIDLGIELN